MLACALGGVMSGGVAQRVADWLDGGTPAGDASPGPPVLLTWQASVIPAVLLVVLGLIGWLARRTLRLRRGELDAVEQDYDDGPGAPRTPCAPAGSPACARWPPSPTGRPASSASPPGDTAAGRRRARRGTGSRTTPPREAVARPYAFVQGAADTAQALGSWLIGVGFLLFVTWGRRAYKDPSARRTIGILWDVGTFWPRAAHPFAPPCYAERAVPDLTWRMATWTAATGGRLVISGHSQGSVLAAAAVWQLTAAVRGRVALLTYGSPLERLYGRWFPAHFGPAALHLAAPRGALLAQPVAAHRPHRRPRRLPGDCGPEVDRGPLHGPARLRPQRQSIRCPRRSSATPTTRPTRPSPRNATSCWPGCGPARRCPGRGPGPGLRAARAGPPGRAGSGRRCSARPAGRPGPRAARPSPRRSAAPYGRCRTPGPLGIAVKYFSSASAVPAPSRYSCSSACCSTIRSSSSGP